MFRRGTVLRVTLLVSGCTKREVAHTLLRVLMARADRVPVSDTAQNHCHGIGGENQHIEVASAELHWSRAEFQATGTV